MTRSVGIDLVHLPAFGAQLADLASTFAAGTFTRGELRQAELRAAARATSPLTKSDPIPHLAARFAAKEAFLKAWDGTRWGAAPLLDAHQVDYRELEVVTDAWGRPALRFHGRIAALLAAHAELTCSVSLSHDGDHAIAVVSLDLGSHAGPAAPHEVSP